MSAPRRVDVLVAGAGPAGAALALNLAPLRSVLLVEHGGPARERIGESLPALARRLLGDMGLLEAFRADGHTPCRGARSRWGSERAVERDALRDLDGHGWLLDRARFDLGLRAAALARGARLLAPARVVACQRVGPRWSVEVRGEEGLVRVECRALVDATGRGARVARALGARRRRRDALVCRWTRGREAARSEVGFLDVESDEDGWWYSAPVPGGARVLAFHTDADLPAARAGAPLLERARALDGLGAVLRERGFERPEPWRARAAGSADLEPVSGDGWLAVGDAALACDPLSSQGLSNALFAGLAAAESLERHLAGERRALQDYAALVGDLRRAYRRQLAAHYGAERRWPGSSFWRRRGVAGQASSR